MKIKRTARNILSITAFAWSIPFAQAGDVLNRETENEPDSVNTVDGEVRLTGFVRDEAQRRKALEIVSAVTGVAAVRDDLAKR